MQSLASYCGFGGTLASQSDIVSVEKFLRARRFTHATRISFNPNLEAVVVEVPSGVVDTVAQQGKTSARQLESIRRQVKERLGIELLFLVTTNDRDELEAGLRYLLKRRFEGAVLDCFISTPSSSLAHIWLDLASSVDVPGDLRDAVAEHLTQVGIRLGEVYVVGASGNVPSKAVILRQAKIHSPVSTEALSAALVAAGFEVPHDRWLRSKLDQLRKDGHLIWRQDSRYVLSEKGLESVPLVRNRNGSDVARALVLARSKWNDQV